MKWVNYCTLGKKKNDCFIKIIRIICIIKIPSLKNNYSLV